MGRTLIIDGMNIAYKAYFKMPQLQDKKGSNSATIYGFLRILNSAYNIIKPWNLIVTWDSKRNFRKEIDSTYKQKRKKEQDASFFQFIKQIKELKKHFPKIGIPSCEVEGYESDDVIATLVNSPINLPAVIYSSDNDLYQLLCGYVSVFTGKNTYTDEQFVEDYGYDPYLFPIYKAIAGCNSDNVKGVSNIGEKKAKDLMRRCEYDIDKIYKEIDKLKYTKQFNHALRLVTLPLEMEDFVPITMVEHLKINREYLNKFFYDYNIQSISVTDFLQKTKPTS